MKLLAEVLFLGPVSLRHPGGKWRDEGCTLGYPYTQGERTYLCFGLKEVAPEQKELHQCHFVNVCMCVFSCAFVCECVYMCPCWDCVVAIFLSVRGRLAVGGFFGHLSLHRR